MDSGMTVNYIILAVVGTLTILWLLYNIVVVRKIRETNKIRKRRTLASGTVEKDDYLQKSLTLIEGSSSKPYKDETLYNIIKNSHLSTQDALFNLNYLLDEMLNFLKIHYRVPGLEIVFNIDTDVPVMLRGNAGLVSQLLINLFEHAVLASKIGVVDLQISVLKQSEKEIALEFKLTDSDKRTNQAELEAKFTDPGISSGSKLSLHVAKLIVEVLHGQLLVSALGGRGNEITFDLLFKRASSLEEYHYAKPAPFVEGIKALIVDRDPEASIVLRKLLISYMPKVVVMQASDFQNIKGKIDRSFGLAIIDQKFLDRETLENMRKNGSIHIAVSEGLFDEPQHHLAVDYHVSKPYTLERIIEMLIIFYGSDIKTENSSADVIEEKERWDEDRFVCDAEIEPTLNIRSEDFSTFEGAKIMIVEDNEINQKVIKGLLGKSNIEIVIAENGVEALKMLPKVMPLDMILMDINMPELDGLETTRRIRADRRFEKLPIVAFTGLNLSEEIAKMEEAGMNAQMAKPMNAGKFYTVFKRFLGNKKS